MGHRPTPAELITLSDSLNFDIEQLSPSFAASIRITRLQHVARLIGTAMGLLLVHVQQILPTADPDHSSSALPDFADLNILNPSNVVRWIVEDHGPAHRAAKQIAHELGDLRTDNIEKLLVAFASLRSTSSLFSALSEDCVLPIYLGLSPILEACQVLMETQACSLLVTRSARQTAQIHRVDHWDHLMKEAAAIMLSVGQPNVTNGIEAGVPTLAGRLIVAMVRVVEQIRRTIGRSNLKVSSAQQAASTSLSCRAAVDADVEFVYDELLATILGVEYTYGANLGLGDGTP